jgi:hypothetical protein
MMAVFSEFIKEIVEVFMDDFSVYGKTLRTMCGSRTGGWSLPCVMSD